MPVRLPILAALCCLTIAACGDVNTRRVEVAPPASTAPTTTTTTTTIPWAALAAMNASIARYVAATAPKPAVYVPAARPAPQVLGDRCGGDLPPCYVKQRESGGNYSAVNPGGCSGRSCGGAWQFDPNTWANYGGYPRAELAPPDVQDERARQLWAGGAGCGHWAAC